jgi:hypothetical protein
VYLPLELRFAGSNPAGMLLGCRVCITNIQNTFDLKKKLEMKCGLQNYALVMLRKRIVST